MKNKEVLKMILNDEVNERKRVIKTMIERRNERNLRNKRG